MESAARFDGAVPHPLCSPLPSLCYMQMRHVSVSRRAYLRNSASMLHPFCSLFLHTLTSSSARPHPLCRLRCLSPFTVHQSLHKNTGVSRCHPRTLHLRGATGGHFRYAGKCASVRVHNTPGVDMSDLALESPGACFVALCLSAIVPHIIHCVRCRF